MQALDIMTQTIISAAADNTVEQLTVLTMENHISAVPILDDEGAIIGLISEGDLMRRVEGANKINKSWWLSLFSDSQSAAANFVATRRDMPKTL